MLNKGLFTREAFSVIDNPKVAFGSLRLPIMTHIDASAAAVTLGDSFNC